MTDTTTTSTSPARSLWRRWSTREILLTAMLGLAFGVIFIPLMYGYMGLTVLGPIAAWATVGFWMVPPFFALYAVRRPGAGLLLMLMSGGVYGLAAEIGGGLATGYQSWSWPRLVLAGLIAGLLGLAFGVFVLRSLQYELWVNAAITVVSLISTIIGVVLAKLLAGAVARTGLLSGSALGGDSKQV